MATLRVLPAWAAEAKGIMEPYEQRERKRLARKKKMKKHGLSLKKLLELFRKRG